MKLPAGYRYSALYAGIRKTAKPDLALIVSDTPASAAAVFTTNRVQAAPVRLGRKHLAGSGGVARAVLVNAGNANCATRTGDRVALACCRAAARALGCRVTEVLPSSTGVIGVEMNASLITAALPALVEGLSAERFLDAADAILTTDLVRKVAVSTSKGYSVAGMTKGSGMIHPGMATTLAYVMTDAVVTPAALRRRLKRAVEHSYNRLSVDGDMSTNDTLLVLANGASGVKPKADEFQAALDEVCQSLAQQIARDGEGAQKFVEIEVTGGRDEAGAARIARAIANSPLVKTAIAGSDPNWGRILCAAGYAGVVFDPAQVDIWLQGVKVCRRGLAAPFDEAALTKKLDEKECLIRFRIAGSGKGAARFWTCDLTHGYIDINASYRT
ncbi:MAG: bifunctional glutamate N-acetyltransferase/amino-acid acetyltransferase ArgJ [Candidatus Solibacter usitatus]|nr:bifunctional glutamate N-acetyltransferase/amino-acid acetyltransferase ArgJ [Candidatus Solibacter usitatus]